MSTFEKLTADDLIADVDRYEGYDDFLAVMQVMIDEDMDKHYEDAMIEFTDDQERAFKDFPFGCSR